MFKKLKEGLKNALVKLGIKKEAKEKGTTYISLEEKVLNLYNRGFKDEDIIRELDINKYLLYHVLNKAGLKEKEAPAIEEVPVVKAVIEEAVIEEKAVATIEKEEAPAPFISFVEKAKKEIHGTKKEAVVKAPAPKERKQYRRLTKEEKEEVKKEILDLYNYSDMELKFIAKKVSCSVATVRNVLKEAGIDYKKIRVETIKK